MPRLPCCLLLLLLAGGAAAGPDDDTGERLYQDCSSQNEFLKGYCGGYITGVIASLVNLQRYRQIPDSLLCLPVDVSKGQLVEAVTRYLDQYPEKRSRQSINLVPEALNEAFPCPQSSPATPAPRSGT
jgi:hypothetical protein